MLYGLNKIMEVVLSRVPVMLYTCNKLCSYIIWASLVAQMGKYLHAMQETWVQFPGSGRSPRERNGNLLQYSCLETPMGREA